MSMMGERHAQRFFLLQMLAETTPIGQKTGAMGSVAQSQRAQANFHAMNNDASTASKLLAFAVSSCPSKMSEGLANGLAAIPYSPSEPAMCRIGIPARVPCLLKLKAGQFKWRDKSPHSFATRHAIQRSTGNGQNQIRPRKNFCRSTPVRQDEGNVSA
jgi:hypothetical protein